MMGYHFTADTLRDGRPIPPIGEWLVHDGPLVVCKFGLHTSKHVFDALRWAPGPRLHRVQLLGELQPHGEPIDKYVGRRRRIIASLDATELLRGYARWCALRVIDLWNAPPVVREFLTTGDERLRDAAWDAAWAAAGAAAGAARDAAEAAAGAAAGAAWAPEDAARAAAWAAEAAARAVRAAWAAEETAQRRHLARLVKKAFTASRQNERQDNG